jgi:hypothetical protein
VQAVDEFHRLRHAGDRATAQGLRFPLRLLARIITGVLVAGGPVEFGEELGHLIITFTAQEAARLNRRPPTRGGQQSAA